MSPAVSGRQGAIIANTNGVVCALRFFVVLVLLGCGRTPYRNFPPAKGTSWIVFGDSLTAGTGASEGHDFPTLLGRRLGKELLNYGVPGNTTADALARVDEVLAADPRVVLVCLGGNDGLQHLPLETTLANLSAIVERLQTQGIFVVLIGVHSATLLDKFQKPFQKLAKEHNTLFIPNILDGLLAKPSLMSDQIHPNDAGNELIAARLEKILRAEGVAAF